jgi:PPOX class probable F420-dependent enzyme
MATVTEVGRPHIVPVTFAVDGNYIYTAVDAKPKNETTARGLQRVRNIEAEPRVALLADHYADDWSSLWWARADGRASIVTELQRTAWPIALLTARYPQYGDVALPGPVIAIRVERWSGWAAVPPG